MGRPPGRRSQGARGAEANGQQDASDDADDDDDDSDPVPTPPIPHIGPPPVGASVERFVARAPGDYFAPLLALAVCFVPAVIFVLTYWENLGGFATILFRDYLTLMVCCLAAWAAAYLPLALVNGILLSYHLPGYDHPALW